VPIDPQRIFISTFSSDSLSCHRIGHRRPQALTTIDRPAMAQQANGDGPSEKLETQTPATSAVAVPPARPPGAMARIANVVFFDCFKCYLAQVLLVDSGDDNEKQKSGGCDGRKPGAFGVHAEARHQTQRSDDGRGEFRCRRRTASVAQEVRYSLVCRLR
jgi:hypothetical protein